MVLLDTHAWIWSVEGDARRIGRRTRQLLGRAESREGIRVSAVSMFEVAALHTAGRLRFASSLEQWMGAAFELAGVRLAELPAAAAIDAGTIPRSALADPLDRLLVASARRLDATFVTADRQILDYAKRTGNVRTHDAGS